MSCWATVINAGVVWEGALAAAKFKLGNLTAVLDYDGIQQTGASADVLPTEPITDKWAAFGWHVQEIDGHNMAEVNTLDHADEVHARPSIIHRTQPRARASALWIMTTAGTGCRPTRSSLRPPWQNWRRDWD